MARLVRVAVTPVTDEDIGSKNLLVEIVSGGDNGNYFTRIPVRNFTYPAGVLQEGIPQEVFDSFVDGMSRAIRLRGEDLLTPRHPSGR